MALHVPPWACVLMAISGLAAALLLAGLLG
jgi:hypothetical protein